MPLLSSTLSYRTYFKSVFLKREFDKAPLSKNEIEVFKQVDYLLSFYKEFESDAHEMLMYFDRPLINRFFKWMEFLTELKNIYTFDAIVKGVMFCFKQQKLITQQTEFQFEQTKIFLKELDSLNICVGGISESPKLLLCLMICSKRPDLMVRSVKQIFTKQKMQFHDTKTDWFTLFFGNNPLLFLGKHLEYLSELEIEFLVSALAGESLRRVCKPYFPMSQKEQALLLSDTVKIENPRSRVLERYIITARLLKVHQDGFPILQHILQTTTFRNDFKCFTTDLAFWQATYTLLYKEWINDRDGNFEDSIRHLLDYIEFKRYIERPHLKFSLRGRTYSSLKRDMDEWHELQDYNYTKRDLEIRWQPLDLETFKISIDNIQYRIEELCNGIALLKEGRRMKHCVFSYLNECEAGTTHIFSLKQKRKRGYKHLVTIEVKNGKITQAHSPHNGPLSRLEENIIYEWKTNIDALGITE